jgi:omega-6 fatty acid desaturase (delta-12 desaturase)
MIAHGCGHHAFSKHEWLEDIVVIIFHACTQVCDQFSSNFFFKSHPNTPNTTRSVCVDHDEVLVP